MSDYDPDDLGPRHGRWRMNSSHSSSSRSGSSRPSSSTFEEEEEEESFIAIPPNLPAWNVKRHLTAGNPTPLPDSVKELGPWRGKENKLKTAHAALVLCLNIGVDPPDVVKTNPCAVLECWIDPFSLPPSKALEAIGKNLVHQFETLNPRMRYKQYPDPSVDDTRKFCIGLRKIVKDERALFYYNGHGVPKPTASGEIWVFNRGYTQYIPVSLHDLQGWLGSPTIYVWDCSAAGHILDNFEKFAKKRDQEFYSARQDQSAQANYAPFMDCIHLAACASDETLPMSPDLPADVFTSALTSPIEMALRFYVLQNQARLSVSIEDAMKIPGDLKDRRTPLGELNWIFTAVTDTIAWTTFPKDLFKRLFRQDWTLAALFRNFLLAERIMRKYNCTPRAFPPLPPSHMHPLWLSWDLAVDKVMVQLPNLLKQTSSLPPGVDSSTSPPWQYENVASVFFEEHLQAFFVWLNRGGSALTKRGPLAAEPANLPAMTPPTIDQEDVVKQNPEDVIATTTGRGKPSSKAKKDVLVPRKPPDQLPILLQVLLSQTHRLRALILLGNFIDLGPWAVHLALTIGIFPYVQKLLQSPAAELRPVLIYIWSRVIAFDQSVQTDLLKDNGHLYFSNLLKPDVVLSIPNEMEHKAMCAFIMALECRDHPTGQQACFQIGLFQSCIAGMDTQDYLMRQWSVLAMALLWDGFDEAKTHAIRVLRVHELLEMMIMDDSAEVRAALYFALSTLFGASASNDPEKLGGGGTGSMLHLSERDHLGFELKLAMTGVLTGKDDASPMVRKEVLVLLSCLVTEWRGWFVVAAWAYWEGSRNFFQDERAASGRPRRQRTTSSVEPTLHKNTVHESDPDVVWNAIEDCFDRSLEPEEVKMHNHVVISSIFILYSALLDLTVDPYPEVANMARTIADWILALLRESPFSKLPGTTLNSIPVSDVPLAPGTVNIRPPTQQGSLESSSEGSRRSSLALTEGTLSSTLKRTSSIATSIKNLAAGYAFPSMTEKDLAMEDPEEISEKAPPPKDPHPPRFEYRATVPNPRMFFIKYISPYLLKSQPSKASIAERDRVQSSTSLRGQRPTGLVLDSHAMAPSYSAPATPKHGRFHFASGRQTPSSGPDTSPEQSTRGMTFSPADVIEALIEEDWERLRARRRVGEQTRDLQNRLLIQQQQQRQQQLQHLQQIQTSSQLPQVPQPLPQMPPQSLSHLAQQHAPRQTVGATATPIYMRAGHGPTGNGTVGLPPQPTVPPQGPPETSALDASWTSGSSFVTTDSEGTASNLSSGLGTGASLANILPLKSRYFDWSMEYFSEPQMRASENEEPGSVVYNEQTWRGQRNERIVFESHRQGVAASHCQWDKSLVTLQNNHPVKTLRFHQFDPHLITSNNDHLISAWDWTKKRRIACFDNGNPDGTSVTSVHFINEEAQTQIVTASADGMVRVFSNYDPETAYDDAPLSLCSAFRALPRLTMSEHRSGLITDWLQPFGLLLVGGDSKFIKIWDAHKENVAAEFLTDIDSCVTSIASDLDAATLVMVGTGNGTLGVYDRRMPRSVVRLNAYENHRSWIQSVHWQRGSDREILSGSLDGQVILWDIRQPNASLMEWDPHQGNGLANLAVHDHSPVFATSASIGKGNARHQSVIVQALPPIQTQSTHLKLPLNATLPLSAPVYGFFPSPGSLAFHPHEMLLGWGSSDGRIKVFGANLRESAKQGLEAVLPIGVEFEAPLPSIASSERS